MDTINERRSIRKYKRSTKSTFLVCIKNNKYLIYIKEGFKINLSNNKYMLGKEKKW